MGLIDKVESSLSGGGVRHPLTSFTSVFKIFVYQGELVLIVGATMMLWAPSRVNVHGF